MDAIVAQLTAPKKIWSLSEVLISACPVPPKPGIYSWYFKELPGCVDTTGCFTHDGLTLLYVGISPKAPPKNGASPSRQSLRSRIRYHFRGNAGGSTLRLTLGCLLSEKLGIELRRVGSGTRMTFSAGEKILSEWMGQNALVCWVECSAPWNVEEYAISRLALPLNIDRNEHHGFCATLKKIRSDARDRARLLPVLSC